MTLEGPLSHHYGRSFKDSICCPIRCGCSKELSTHLPDIIECHRLLPTWHPQPPRFAKLLRPMRMLWNISFGQAANWGSLGNLAIDCLKYSIFYWGCSAVRIPTPPGNPHRSLDPLWCGDTSNAEFFRDWCNCAFNLWSLAHIHSRVELNALILLKTQPLMSIPWIIWHRYVYRLVCLQILDTWYIN
jgi:hypothetical protein